MVSLQHLVVRKGKKVLKKKKEKEEKRKEQKGPQWWQYFKGNSSQSPKLEILRSKINTVRLYYNPKYEIKINESRLT